MKMLIVSILSYLIPLDNLDERKSLKNGSPQFKNIFHDRDDVQKNTNAQMSCLPAELKKTSNSPLTDHFSCLYKTLNH